MGYQARSGKAPSVKYALLLLDFSRSNCFHVEYFNRRWRSVNVITGAQFYDRGAKRGPGDEPGQFHWSTGAAGTFLAVHSLGNREVLPPSFLNWSFCRCLAAQMQVIIGLFLISTVFQYRFGKRKHSFTMKLWYFFPLGLLIPFISTVTGALGPLLNPFLLNYEMSKEGLIATKTFNSFAAGLVQISSYTFFGALHGKLWWWGLALGAGISLGNYMGKALLSRISETSFRQWAIVFMVISGIIMLLKIFL